MPGESGRPGGGRTQWDGRQVPDAPLVRRRLARLGDQPVCPCTNSGRMRWPNGAPASRTWVCIAATQSTAAFTSSLGMAAPRRGGRARPRAPAGITAYRPDGRRAFHLLDDRRVEIAGTSGAVALVRVAP